MRAAAFALLGLIFVVSAPVGCGDSNNGTGGGAAAGSAGTGGASGGGAGGMGGEGDRDGSTGCDRPDVDKYSANMTKKGINDVMSFVLVQSDPGPPIKGNATVKLKITGADGMPVSSGLVVDVFMPEHNHPSPVSPKITYDAASGTFTLDPVYFFMPGKWRLRFDIVDTTGTLIDRGEFFFCIS
jgi:hypothetical protein